MEKNMNLEQVLRSNHDLFDRVEREGWRIFYDKGADMFVLHGAIAEGTEYVPVNDAGLMVRVDGATEKICALAIEHFGEFAKKHSDFRLIYMYLRHPIASRIVLVPIMAIMRAMDTLSERYQRTEMIEYVSREAMFRTA
jgi:hypothetical protein